MLGMYLDISEGEVRPFIVEMIYYDCKIGETIFMGRRPSGHAIRITADEITLAVPVIS